MDTKIYVEAWYEVVMHLIDIYRQYAGLKVQSRKLLFLITPSVDTSVGAHLDIDVFTIISGKRLKNSHATMLSDTICAEICRGVNVYQERIYYVRALSDHGDQLFLNYGPFECVIQLERTITKTDSAKIQLSSMAISVVTEDNLISDNDSSSESPTVGKPLSPDCCVHSSYFRAGIFN
jgi:hypothetical protein